jgi:magnesium-protoporphyrin O-methyltransferase
MTCCDCGSPAERQFGEKRATKDLTQYRTKGPGATARLLLAGLTKVGPLEGRLLDIGSGIGALSFELLDRGLTSAVGVDLSSAYVTAALDEAKRRGRSDAVQFVHGDFVEVAEGVRSAEVVTLDRVVCCYPDYERLLDESLRHAARLVALSYPRDAWYVRAGVSAENLWRQLRGSSFRTYVHSPSAMEARIRREGFVLLNRGLTRTWCADVYQRAVNVAKSYLSMNDCKIFSSETANDTGTYIFLRATSIRCVQRPRSAASGSSK